MKNHTSPCPFINRDDPRCAGSFSLSRIRDTFTRCLSAFHACPVYQQLQREQAPDHPGHNGHVAITINGDALEHAFEDGQTSEPLQTPSACADAAAPAGALEPVGA